MRRFERADVFFAGVLLALMSVFVGTPQSVAQTVTGRILGTIRDQQGAVIPGASVTARNVETGAERTVTSDELGVYNIVSIPAGTYAVTAAGAGFRTEVRSGVTMTVGASIRVDFTMTLGAVAERIEVTAEAPQVDTTTATMGAVVSQTEIEGLALNGRDWLQLPFLQAGVVQPTLGSRGAQYGYGTRMSISGSRVGQNTFRMDGITTNDQANGTPGSVLGIALGVDAIREFSVLTTSYSAEYGRGSGGVINAVTKSGTNTLHGTGLFFHRNSALDEKSFFNEVDEPIPPFRRHQFGGSLGGPIVRDKLFFFANYEGVRQFLSRPLSENTLTADARKGLLCDNAACTTKSQVQVDPRVAPYLSVYPLPNGEITGDTGRYFKGAGEVGVEDFLLTRIDYNINENSTLNGSYNFDDGSNGSPGAFGLVDVVPATDNQRAMLTFQHVFSPAVLNTMRGGVNRTIAGGTVETLVPELSDLSYGFVPGQAVGTIVVPGIGILEGLGYAPLDFYTFTSFQFYDDLSWVKGRHNMRMGFNVDAIRNNMLSSPIFGGTWRFGSIRDYVTASRPQLFDGVLPGSNPYFGHRTKVFGAYFQDDFRLSPRLTLNLGLRYEPQTRLSEVDGKVAALLRIEDEEVDFRNTFYTENPSLRHFAPRFGFAYDLFGDGRTSIRGGVGKYDILIFPNVLLRQVVNMWPYAVQGTINRPPASSFPNQAINLVRQSGLRGFYVEHAPPASYKLQWNLNVQRQITEDLSITAGYVGSRGLHLINNQPSNINFAPSHLARFENGRLRLPGPPPANRRNSSATWGRITGLLANADSVYHGLQLSVSKRMSRGITAQASYTWSKSLDSGSVDITDTELQSSKNGYPELPHLYRGPSDFDIDHRLSVNFLWQVPALASNMFLSRLLLSGWELSGIFTAQGGVPFHLLINEDVFGANGLSGRGGNFQRPDFLTGAGCKSPSDAILPIRDVVPGQNVQYVNLDCFGYPEPFTWGNMGRGALRNPSLVNFDFAIVKQHALSERLQLQLRADFFNLFNRYNFGIGTFTAFDSQKGRLPTEALLDRQVTSPRQIQLGARFIF